MSYPYWQQEGSTGKGVFIGLSLLAVGVLGMLFFEFFEQLGKMGFLFIPVAQLVCAIPLYRHTKKSGQTDTATGVMLGSGIAIGLTTILLLLFFLFLVSQIH